MTDLTANRQQVLNKIQNICLDCKRSAQSVSLLAVSKMQPAGAIRTLFEAGQRIFAENYLQEALAKQADLSDLAIEWHFIGQIQRNKTRDIAAHFSWVHGVDRLIIAERFSQHIGDANLPRLNILIQVNIDHEDSKGGCLPDALHELVAQISALPNIALRGLMVIPAPDHQDAFTRTQALFETVRHHHAHPADWDCLSMGMSGDFDEAIRAGSTMVRVGTALFGARG